MEGMACVCVDVFLWEDSPTMRIVGQRRERELKEGGRWCVPKSTWSCRVRNG